VAVSVDAGPMFGVPELPRKSAAVRFAMSMKFFNGFTLGFSRLGELLDANRWILHCLDGKIYIRLRSKRSLDSARDGVR
jgi:hypothetical protein